MSDRSPRELAALRATYSGYTVAEMMVVFHRLVHEKAADDGPNWTYWGAARGAIVELGVLDRPAAIHVGQESVDLPIPAEQWCRFRQIDGTYVSSRHNRTEREARDHELQNNEHYLARGGILDKKGRAPESARLEAEDLLVLLAADTERRAKTLRGDRSAALAERRAERRYRMGS